ECARRACDLAVEFLTGIFLENNFRCESFVNRRRIFLRREHVNTKHIALHDAEKWRPRISSPTSHERAKVDISSCDLSSNRREDLLESLNFLELLQVPSRPFMGFFVLIVLLFVSDFLLDHFAQAC